MLETRVIPSLLLKNGGLVKTVKFSRPVYVGDPINAVRIFNDKEVDELVILDIEASRSGQGPNFELLTRIAREAFMPMGYGGGIHSLEQARRIFALGYEKVIINTAAQDRLEFVTQLAGECGSQSIVVCVDVIRDLFGKYHVFDHRSKKKTAEKPLPWIKKCIDAGAGEILLYSVDRDGTFKGFDLELIRSISDEIQVPLIALGGAGNLDDLVKAINEGHASAVAAGSLFVFHGPNRAVLITYPKKEIEHRFLVKD